MTPPLPPDIDQLKKTMALMGTPGPALLAKITSDEARRFIASLQVTKQQDFKRVFRTATPAGMQD